MKCKGTDGKSYVIAVNTKQSLKPEEQSRSKFQFNCGQILKTKYPYSPIIEEQYIPSEKFYFDFMLPHEKIIVEVQGRQHSEKVAFFQTQAEFMAQRARDVRKNEWCRINGFILHKVNSEEDLKTCLNLQ